MKSTSTILAEKSAKTSQNKVSHELQKLLASTYILYLKTQNFHWNVTGALFPMLHSMFESQYTALSLANDEIAERIRALKDFAPGSFREFSELSFIEESFNRLSAEEMMETLLADHEALIDFCKTRVSEFTNLGDDASADLLVGRIQEHEKTAWMIRSFLA